MKKDIKKDLKKDIKNQDLILLNVDKRKDWGKDGKGLREALVIPGDFEPDSLERDVENGAYPFKELTKMKSYDLDSKVIFIRTTSEEYGYMAAAYLAAKALGDNFCDEETFVDAENIALDRYNPGYEGSICNLIPIISVMEIAQAYDDYEGFSFGNFNFNSQGSNNKNVPYWDEHNEMIIVKNPQMSVYDYRFTRESLVDSITRVMNKSKIFIIDVMPEPVKVYSGLEEDDEDRPVNPDFLKALVKFNAASVDVAPENDMEYMEKVFAGICKKHSMAIPKDFPRKEFILRLSKSIFEMRIEFMNQLIVREATRTEGKKELSKDVLKLLSRITPAKLARLKGWELLDSLEGMEKTKEEIRMLVNAMKLNKLRSKRGFRSEPIVACMFAGAPGTAKTTAAQALADILAEEQLLPAGRFTSVSGSGLQAEYVGQTSGKVRSLVEGADVLLVDECYSLCQEGHRKSPYADEALAELCLLMTEAAERGDKLFIFAGYGGADSGEENNLMKLFLNSNPGIKSRVSTVINFPSYTPEAMSNIFLKICDKDGVSFSADDKEVLKKMVKEYFEERVGDPAFGNGREACNLVSEAMRMHSEIMNGKAFDQVSDKEISTLTVSDVNRAIESLKKMEITRAGRGAAKISLVG